MLKQETQNHEVLESPGFSRGENVNGLAMYASNGANAYFQYVLDKITINQ